MFSHWYATKDAALLKGGPTEQLDYAGELLAEILNRALALSNAYHLVYRERLGADWNEPGAKMDYDESVDGLLHLLGIFSQDMEEALARARRASLVYGADRFGGIHTGSVDDQLEDIGGSLVPWHEDHKATHRVPAGVAK